MKRAFTLVELLVVMGIIGILAGVLVASFGRTTEAARAAKCLANLRSLATAANAHNMSDGHYPLAGSVEIKMPFNRKVVYREIPGWISWLSCDGQYGRSAAGFANDMSDDSVQYPQAHQTCDICPWYGTGDRKRDEWALANGALWSGVGRNRSLYVCPTHERSYGRTPVFSYVMNAKFGFDVSHGTKPAGVNEDAIPYGSIKKGRADRTILFAEVHMKDEDSFDSRSKDKKKAKQNEKGNGPEYDAVLNYKATVNGKKYGTNWDGNPEQIGFPHLGPKGCRVGHVVFADGHVAKLTEATGRGGSANVFQLTAILCEGLDYAYEDGGYMAIRDDDTDL